MMSSSEESYELVSSQTYEQAFADLSLLQTQLPQKEVVSLAREVLNRLARQLRDPRTRADDVLDLADALIGDDPRAATLLINRHMDNGADFDRIYLEYLAPAAKLLGDWWSNDSIGFSKVTTGTGRIYAIMRSLSRRVTAVDLPERKSAFFASVPDEDHTLGLKMAADLARKAGWHIDFELECPHKDIVDQIVESGHLLVGLSAAGIHALPNLARLVLALRISAPNARILVSGNIIDAAEESVRLMHVDGMGRSFEEAMEELNRLWATLEPAGT